MKLSCTNNEGVIHGALIVGQDYTLTQVYNNWYEVNGISVTLKNFESLKDRVKRLFATSTKIILPAPTKGVIVDILLTDKYIILYSHSRGNHWNVFGNHYKYYHDIDTGELIPDQLIQPYDKFLKARLLMADYKEITKSRLTIKH
jgi:hypothetical protein